MYEVRSNLWSQDDHRMVTGWSQDGHWMVTGWSLDGEVSMNSLYSAP